MRVVLAALIIMLMLILGILYVKYRPPRVMVLPLDQFQTAVIHCTYVCNTPSCFRNCTYAFLNSTKRGFYSILTMRLEHDGKIVVVEDKQYKCVYRFSNLTISILGKVNSTFTYLTYLCVNASRKSQVVIIHVLTDLVSPCVTISSNNTAICNQMLWLSITSTAGLPSCNYTLSIPPISSREIVSSLLSDTEKKTSNIKTHVNFLNITCIVTGSNVISVKDTLRGLEVQVKLP